ncbi:MULTISPECIES: hypothetical protein [Streptomyces]|uniref:Uncharacterized protein n=1 Tax=Streptomyces katrae TaxID=68223 RepID=A0ABT7GUH9_9ACTN|nr:MULTISPECIES: hypothetical protein [Streptomyces]MDK9497259.1 hypothetical protein [Streptomyces katrae]RST05769.1 hypothetical protein EF910_11415 [Streptomyces sp. WAC07149]GLX21367.1 hypothetical protein Slala01_50110 [Streptomyces lavendulae subsp. lavendulae]GLX27885.1 hypothetical protein Slala02_37050 [Streptomyces lavendulae subsp. lavendulae]
MQNTWRTQVKRITIAIIAAVAIAGGVQIASDTATATPGISADGTTQQTPAAPAPTPSSTTDEREWG